VSDRRVWLARLPETRIAYFDEPDAYERSGEDLFPKPTVAALWERFNEWRLRTRPALGRIDISAMGFVVEGEGLYRAAVPIRGDYRPVEPAKTALFPGGTFAYVYADDTDEVMEAAATAARWIIGEGLSPASGLIEVHKYHYNLDQHPCDVGFLVTNEDGSEPIPPPLSHSNPLPIAH